MTTGPRLAAIAAAIFVSGLTDGAIAQVQKFSVDCSKGQTISSALQQGDSRKPIVLTVKGTCSESILIERDDVTLQGDSSNGATVTWPTADRSVITVRAARIVLDGLTVTGGGIGINIVGSSNVRVRRALIQYNGQTGMQISASQNIALLDSTVHYAAESGIRADGSVVRINGSEISFNKMFGIFLGFRSGLTGTGNTIGNNGAAGLGVWEDSTALMYEGTISNNGTDPNQDFRQGVYVYFGRAEFRGSTISNNAGGGLVGTGTMSVFDSHISANGGEGVLAGIGSVSTVDSSSIMGNQGSGIGVGTADAQIAGSTKIQKNAGYGISIGSGARLLLLSPTDVTGNVGWGLYCTDASSKVNQLALVTGTVSPMCAEF